MGVDILMLFEFEVYGVVFFDGGGVLCDCLKIFCVYGVDLIWIKVWNDFGNLDFFFVN